MRKKDSSEDLIAGEDRTLIPEGKYTAHCIEAKNRQVGQTTGKGTYAQTLKAILKFKIIDGEYQGQEIPMFLNVNYERIPFGSKFYQFWVIANDCKRPGRKDRMSLDKFKGHIFSVGLKTVKRTFEDGTEKPESLWYSRVDEIYEKLA